jgi:hypothetical protein
MGRAIEPAAREVEADGREQLPAERPLAGLGEALLALVRERAQALARGPELYDALLDEREPGMARARLEPGGRRGNPRR